MIRRLIYRPSSHPSVALPFGARSVGEYLIPSSSREENQPRGFVQLYWGIRGTGTFELENRTFSLGPGDTFFTMLDDPQHLSPTGCEWHYRWLTLDGSLAEATAQSFGFGRRIVHSGRCPEELFTRLEAEIRELSHNGERRAAATAFKILTLAAGHEPNREEGLVGACKGLIHDEVADPELCVDRLASHLGVHRSVLSREFSAATGISPSRFITSLRMQLACSLLKETTKTVEEISAEVGYSTSNYFCKVFRKAAGRSPIAFRRDL